MKKAAFSSRFIMLYMPLHGGFSLMSAVAFDTLKFAERLPSGGFTPEQSKVVSYAFAEATGEQLVTRQVLKDELAPIKQELITIRQEIKQEFGSIRQETGQEFATVRQEMKQEFASVRQEMKDEFASVRQEMTDEFASVRQDMQTESVCVRQEFASVQQDMQKESMSVKQEFSSVRQEIALVKADIAILKWMNGFTLAAVMAIFYLLLRQH